MDILNGFSLVGEVPLSNCLPKKFVPAELTVESMKDQSGRSNQAIRWSTRSSGDILVDAELWEKTTTEASKGWLVGPLEWESLPAES